MEANMQRKTQGLKEKIPDIQKTLDTVAFLQTQKVGRHFSFLYDKYTANIQTKHSNTESPLFCLARFGTYRDYI